MLRGVLDGVRNRLADWIRVPGGDSVESPADPGITVDALDDLRDWWLATAHQDMTMVAPKAVEYGSVELEEMGTALARMMGRTDPLPAYRVELACWFYAMGKMQRWTAAITRGETASTDTLTDLGVYTLMVRRARQAGTWPGNPGA